MQAISGHLDLLSREQSIKDLLGEQKTNEEIRDRLSLTLQVREFASNELKLPDNDSYKTYVDLERPYAVWSVIATPAYSINAKQWCFLVVGCLSYRGYFDKQEALDKAHELKQEGYDVSVAGTTAYSTLGFFDDPLLSTMVRQGESSMIGLIFHELAHQQVHVDGDTAFNEAFATTVEQEGLYRWYTKRGEIDKYHAYLEKKKNRQLVFGFLKDTRKELDTLYKQDLTDAQKQKQKAEAFDRLRERYRKWQLTSNYHGFDHWMKKELNNSHLALIATYQDLVPNFFAILKSVNGDLEVFYKKVEQLGALDIKQRETQLAGYVAVSR